MALAKRGGVARRGSRTTFLIAAVFGLSLLAGRFAAAMAQPELLVYCGITMIQPMSEIALEIERRSGFRVTLIQGGSEDLYQSLRMSGKGDLYLPGSPHYRERHLDEGLLSESVRIGYNRAALMVRKGNPKSVVGDVRQLLRADLDVVVCNPESGSIGHETERILRAAGIYEQVFDRSVYLGTDSRNLNGAVKRGDADLVLNWRATGFFAENRDEIDVIDLDAADAVPEPLDLILLRSSAHPGVAREFMAYAASPDGQAILRRYGFADGAVGR